MDNGQILALAILQGLTEFLPISSSAHLILVPRLIGWQDQGLAFDVAVHVGTLTAVVSYFRHTLITMSREWTASLFGATATADSRLGWAVLLGTIPVGLAGLLFDDLVETQLRSPEVIAWSTIGFGLLLGWSDRYTRGVRGEENLQWRDILIVGLAQALALIPGTSRSGITMTAGLTVGLHREGAARFSFLLSIPVIFLAGGLKTVQLAQRPGPIDWTPLVTGAVLSGISAYLCIEIFLKLIDRTGMMPFVLYRLALGALLLLLFA